jgi:alkylhydroperoxidase family enzyme
LRSATACDWCIDFGRSLTSGRAARQGRPRPPHTTSGRNFSAAERAALRYADEAGRARRWRCPTRRFATLREHFDERQIVELTFAVAAEGFYNRINAPLGIEAEGFCALAPVANAAAA